MSSFPTALVSEAVGQLAAWAAMATVNFQSRPVAGIAAEIVFLAPVRPGQVLELAADLETVDNEAAAYSGTAHAEGIPLVRLQNCVGPMLPVADFDDPQAVRDRFTLLQGEGAAPGGFEGLPDFQPRHVNGEPGRDFRATLQVPAAANFFADHFPRRPVFPGALLMECNLRVVAAFAAQLPAPAGGGGWRVSGLSDLKLRAFTPPGEALEIEARLTRCEADSATVSVETRNGKRAVSVARVKLVPEVRP